MTEWDSRFPIGMMIPLIGSSILSSIDTVLGVHVRTNLEAGLLGAIFLTASVVLWFEELHWASSGYLIMIGSAVLLVFPQSGAENSLAIVGVFGCLLVGFVLVIYEAIVHVESRRDRDSQPSNGA